MMYILCLVGCGGGSVGSLQIAPTSTPVPTPTSVSSGIRGVAMEGPISPVVVPGQPDSRPLSNALITVQPAGGGREITRTRTDANGRFRILLPPGTYLIVPLPPQPDAILPHAGSQTVVVRPNTFTDLTIDYDTGIRSP